MKLLTAIIICDPQPVTGKTALKYHNIPEEGPGFYKFLAFAGKFPGAREVNFYYKIVVGNNKGIFKEKIYLQ